MRLPAKGGMRSVEVVEALPRCEVLLQVDVALIGQELIELVLVGPVRALCRRTYDPSVIPSEL